MQIDMPTATDIQQIAAARDPLSVTVYIPTSHVPKDMEHNLLRARALFEAAMQEVASRGDKHEVELIEEQFEDLLDDRSFWQDMGRSLAIFLTPSSAKEFRLPNHLEDHFSVNDRFSIVPLLRATTFPQAAFVLALSQNGNRIVEVSASEEPRVMKVAAMPQNAADAAGVASISGRSPYGRIQGDEGRKLRLRQYSRAIDHALRPTLNGQSLPLILAATQPLLGIYQKSNGYAHLAESVIRGNPDELSEAELASSARQILDEIYADELKQLQETFLERRDNGRASADLSDLARAAAAGAIATLVVDMGAKVSGSVHDDGSLELHTGHDVLEEIARLAIGSGARVLAVRSSDMPGQVQAAGILRYAI